MRILSTLALVLAASSVSALAQSPAPAAPSASVSPLKRPKMQMPMAAEDSLRAASAEELEVLLKHLNKFIGTYPPKLRSVDEHAKIYALWSQGLQQAWRLDQKDPKSERHLALLAEFYRMGYNMNIARTEKRADETLQRCLKLYPDSIQCNFSASYFYVAYNPGTVPKAEASLMRLRKVFAPKLNPEVERGMVFVYLHSGRKEKAMEQLDAILKLDPTAAWATKLRQALKDGKVEVRKQK
jgi:tetratricopeptide (TPR) repeat protein